MIKFLSIITTYIMICKKNQISKVRNTMYIFFYAEYTNFLWKISDLETQSENSEISSQITYSKKINRSKKPKNYFLEWKGEKEFHKEKKFN